VGIKIEFFNVCDIFALFSPNLGIELIIWSFGDLRTVIMIWICMMAAVFSLYLLFHFYASNRHKVSLQRKSENTKELSYINDLSIFFVAQG
jgi:hypothetical protein